MASTTTTTTATTAAPEIAVGLIRPPELPPRHSNTDDDFELLLVERGGFTLELVTGARRKYENKHMALAREVHLQTGLRLPPVVPAMQNTRVRDRVLSASAEISADVAVFHVLLQRADTYKMRDQLVAPQALLAIEALVETTASALDVERLAARAGAPVRLVWCPLWLLKRLAQPPPLSPVAGGRRRRRTLGPLLQWYMRHHIAYELLSVTGALLIRPYSVDAAALSLRLIRPQQMLSPCDLVGPRKYSTDWTLVAESAATLAAARRTNAQSAVSPRPAVAAKLALAICCSELIDDQVEQQSATVRCPPRQRLGMWNVLLKQVPGERGTILLDLVTARAPVNNIESDRATKGAVVRTMRECFELICKAEVRPIPLCTDEEKEEEAAAAAAGKDWKLLCMCVGHSSAVALMNKPSTNVDPHETLSKAGWQWWSMQHLQHLHSLQQQMHLPVAMRLAHRSFLGRAIESYYFGPALKEFLRRKGWASPRAECGADIAAIWRPPAANVVVVPKHDDVADVAAARPRGPLEDGEVNEEEEEEEEEHDVICAPPALPLQPLLPLHRPLAVPVAPHHAAAAPFTADIKKTTKHPPIGSQRTLLPKKIDDHAAAVLSVWSQLIAATGGFDPARLQQQWQQPQQAPDNDGGATPPLSPLRGPPSPERYPRYRHPHYFRCRAEEEDDAKMERRRVC